MAARATGDTSALRRRWTLRAALRKACSNRGLSAERPVLILSENDLEHALLALGCLLAGVAYCPTSPPTR